MRQIIFAICFLLASVSYGQKVSAKKMAKAAKEFSEAGKFADAAEAYAAAYDADKKKEKYAYEAAYAFFVSRNYKNALKYFRPTSRESEDFPLSKFFYAKSLKAEGMYDKAIKSFRNFRRNYPGDPSDDVLKMALVEIAGCEMAMDLEGRPSDVNISPLSINSNADEFACVPFSEDILYYSVAENGKTEMKRSQFAGGDWSAPVAPNLPKGPDGNTCNGAFSPDHSSFYFTVCIPDPEWSGRDASCELYGTTKQGNTWSTPERLRDYLKMDGNTATHPTVEHRDGKEWLYFVSDRTGGEGGLDIWYTTREIASTSFDFTFPENAGSMINTPGDEFSPFYSVEEGVLYFSSNGHPNIGGFDIYSSKGYGMKWQEALHQGTPINSPTDDYYFQKAAGGNLIFLASNRSTIDWETTTDDNLFQIGMTSNPLVQVDGRVLDRNSMEPVSTASVMVRQQDADGEEVLLTTQYTEQGQYKVPLMAGKSYKLEALAEGYAANAIVVEAADLASKESFTKDIYLEAQDLPTLAANTPTSNDTKEEEFASWDDDETTTMIAETVEAPPVMAVTSGSMGTVENNEVVEMTTTNNVWSPVETVPSSPTTTYNTSKSKEVGYSNTTDNNEVSSTTSTSNYTNSFSSSSSSSATNDVEVSRYATETSAALPGDYTNSRYKNDGVRTSAPKHNGSYYKIQVSIELDMDNFASDIDRINSLGRIDTEHILENGWIRVLLADYFSKEEALQVLYEVRDRGFPEAFLVRYQDGFRKI